MQPQDALLTMSEVAVGLLGFGGVVVAFSSTEARANELYRIRLAGLLGAAASVLLLSILPLYYLAAGESVAWDALCGIQGCAMGVFAAFFLREWYRLGTGSRVLGTIGVVGTSSLGVYELEGWLHDGDFQQYLVGLLWQLGVSTIMFVRMAQVSLSRRAQ